MLQLSLNNIATLYQDQGNYVAALPLQEQALSIRKTALGENHPDVAMSLNNLAMLYQDQGNYTAALPLFEQALSIRKTALGENHPDVATSLNSLAMLSQRQGNYTAALPLFEQALSIRKTALGENHPDVATSLNNLAMLYQAQGNYVAALPLLEQALSILETALGENHPDVATSLGNIAMLYQDQGNYTAALPLFEQALSILETALGENHPDVAMSLNNIATLYQDQGNYTAALPLHEQALSIRKTALGENHPDVAMSLNNLAMLSQRQGNYTAALPLHEQALSINKTALGENHPDVAVSLNNIATLYQAQGNYTAALPLFEQALSINKTALGENHPNVATGLENLAILHWAQSDIDQAVKFLVVGREIEENNLGIMLLSASEARRHLYIQTLKESTNTIISFNIQNAQDNLAATDLALSTVLQRKGRVLDSTANSLQRLRQQLAPDQRSQLDELSTTRSAISNLQASGLGDRTPEQYQTELNRLEAKAEAIEEQLARLSAEFRAETTPVSIAAVKAQIPADAALIEFIRYKQYNPKDSSNSWGADYYAAYVLTQQGEAKAIDLGLANDIDSLVSEFQNALSTQSASTTTIARQLDQKLMAPLRPYLSDKTHLLLSPDSQLNLIPFDALVDENDRYLIETYQTSYLSSGRNLLQLQANAPSQQPAVIIANPNYAGDETVAATNNKSSRSVDADSLSFAPLPGTAQEANAIAPLLPNATLFTEDQATETNLKQVTSPSILHIATHGFFLPDVAFILPSANPDSRNALGASFSLIDTEAPIQITPSNTENPLLRSGLALAGANVRSSGSEDGIFTALEASSLNLSGTKLVVLSACETGIGSISNGEGVYGLRRTFAIAGAESQMMSLWKVSDTGTSELMKLYYQNLVEKKQGRSEALRNAQLELLNTGTYQHPYYWSSFIFSGDWRPLE